MMALFFLPDFAASLFSRRSASLDTVTVILGWFRCASVIEYQSPPFCLAVMP